MRTREGSRGRARPASVAAATPEQSAAFIRAGDPFLACPRAANAAAIARQWFEIDVSSVLPTINVLTLVMARAQPHLPGTEHTATWQRTSSAQNTPNFPTGWVMRAL
jgi:hypothetical protein